MRSYRPEELFDDDGPPFDRDSRAGAAWRSAHGRQSARQRRGCSRAIWSSPTSATTASTCTSPGGPTQRGDAGTRRMAARRHSAQADDNFRLMGPDETASNRLDAVLRGHRPCLGGGNTPDRRSPRSAMGGSWRCCHEHLCQGWLEGYLLTGRHGLFNCYEAFIHIIDSMFNQHAKWLKVTRTFPWRPSDRVAELPADVARLAAGQQRILPSGSRVHRSRREQESRGRPGLPPARHQHACCRWSTIACAAATTSTSSWPANSRRSTGCPWTRRPALHPRHRHLGMGESTTKALTPMW